ncbi:VPLPA-CTERM sorting domain-containing protein [Roseibium sp. MMSF_3412]|uniref:VPLPA-CTERM sorting domain-containing protein n=1 Tax=Roseibium sp. MMSF_3412 TaxID=3046712 RepID=UPI00273E3411|nr:VPLPA-CTERM sorting domain-containing protein [Roseibium sp. MMSF_3412]
MKFLGLALAAALLAFPLASAEKAHAIPVSGNVTEGGPNFPNPDSNGLVIDHALNDFSNGTGSPVLDLTGDTHIFGTVRHLNSTKHKDGWTMNFGATLYNVMFSWMPFSDQVGFDGNFNYGTAGPLTSFGFDGSGSQWIGVFSGTWKFQVDPIAGVIAPTEDGYWTVKATVVPLPAGGLLLLTALGGMALYRSRRKA